MPYKQRCHSHYHYPHNRDGKGEISDVNIITNINQFKTNVVDKHALYLYIQGIKSTILTLGVIYRLHTGNAHPHGASQ